MAIPKKVRAKVTERDRGVCLGCGDSGNHQHHITFKSRGGVDEEGNLATLCLRCHGRAHGLYSGETIEAWELFLVLRGRAASIAALRSSDDRTCGSCDYRTESDVCMAWGYAVTWDDTCCKHSPRTNIKRFT